MDRAPWLVLAASTLVACGSTTDVDSADVVTRNIWAGIELEARGNGNTRVKVELNENGSSGSNIRLTANERLEASAGGNSVTLTEDLDIADIDYEGTLPIDTGGTEVRIRLFRSDGTVIDASTGVLPERLFVTTPVRRQRVNAGDPLAIVWSPAISGAEVSVSVSTICPVPGGGSSINAQSMTIDDSGSYLLDTGQLNATSDPNVNAGTRCDMTLRITRRSDGSLDPRFRGGGYVRATQLRVVDDMVLTL